MKRTVLVLLALLLVASLVLAGCQTEEPTEEPMVEDPMDEPEAFEPMVVSAGDCEYGGKILEIAALDESTVEFTLCKSDPPFWQKSPLHRSIFNLRNGLKKPV